MMILQILSNEIGIYDKQLQSYIIWGAFYPRVTDLGGLPAPGRWQLTPTNLFVFLDYLPGFANYTFFNFRNRFFSLHLTV